MTQVVKNDKTITNAFNRIHDDYFSFIKRGMIMALKAGVIVALDIHDQQHQRHIETGGSYGWGLWYNKTFVDGEVKANGSVQKGNAANAIKKMKPKRKGWYGVVMAGMKGNYYAISYERDILTLTSQEIAANFSKYFKKL